MPSDKEQYRRQELSVTDAEQLGRLIAPLLFQQLQPELEKITDNLTTAIADINKKIDAVKIRVEKQERIHWHITGIAAGIGSVLGVAVTMIKDWYHGH